MNMGTFTKGPKVFTQAHTKVICLIDPNVTEIRISSLFFFQVINGSAKREQVQVYRDVDERIVLKRRKGKGGWSYFISSVAPGTFDLSHSRLHANHLTAMFFIFTLTLVISSGPECRTWKIFGHPYSTVVCSLLGYQILRVLL